MNRKKMIIVVIAVLVLAILTSFLWSNIQPNDDIENNEKDAQIKTHTETSSETEAKKLKNPTQTTTETTETTEQKAKNPTLTQAPFEESLETTNTQPPLPEQSLEPTNKTNTKKETHQACETPQQTKEKLGCEELKDRRWKSETDKNQSVSCWSEGFVCDSCCHGEKKGIGQQAQKSCWVGIDQRNGYKYDWNNPDAYKHCCGI